MEPEAFCIEIGADIFEPLLASVWREKPLLELRVCVFVGEVGKLHGLAVRPVACLRIPSAKRTVPRDDSEARQVASVPAGLQDDLPSQLVPCVKIFFCTVFYFLHS